MAAGPPGPPSSCALVPNLGDGAAAHVRGHDHDGPSTSTTPDGLDPCLDFDQPESRVWRTDRRWARSAKIHGDDRLRRVSQAGIREPQVLD